MGTVAEARTDRTARDEPGFRHAFQYHKKHCRELLIANGCKSVCEIGGGRTPLFTDQEIAELGVEYTILDISESELEAAPSRCRKVLTDICSHDRIDAPGRYDFMFSRLLAEHVSDASAMHRNVFNLLRPGGLAFHFFPTLFTPAFVINRLLPERVAWRLLAAVSPSRRSDSPKFPARYSKCFGPIPSMYRFVEQFGFQLEEYRPFYGTDYLARAPLLRTLETFLTERIAEHLGPRFTSYAWLVARKPRTSE
jgi:SAM-dependent methyltransferase